MSDPFSFRLEQSQSQKQSQVLMMLPQMQQAISMLQAPMMELQQLVDQEMESNPLLEYLEEPAVEREEPEEKPFEEQELQFNENDFSILQQLDDEYRDFFNQSGEVFASSETKEQQGIYVEQSIISPESIYEHLMEQAHQTFSEEKELDIASAIAGNLNDKGFLTTPIQEIADEANASLAEAEIVWRTLQTFDPPGIAAKDTRHSLLTQLTFLGKRESVAYRIVKEFYEDLLHNRLPVMHKATKIPLEELRSAIDHDIAHLDLQPGSSYRINEPIQIVPDGSILEVDGKVEVIVNDESLPSIRVNRKYLRMLKDPHLDKETSEFIHRGLSRAKGMLKNLFQRNKTIHRIMHVVAKKQANWFLSDRGTLIPMAMAEVAEELDLHESTIARAVQNKYVFTPRGMRPLRHFFTHAIESDGEGELSAHTALKRVEAIFAAEDKTRPLSDEKVRKILLEEGMHCARRTVAKYRTKLGIGNASQRRIHKSS